MVAIIGLIVSVLQFLLDVLLFLLRNVVYALVALAFELVVRHPEAAAAAVVPVLIVYFFWTRRLARAGSSPLAPRIVLAGMLLVAMAATSLMGGSQYSNVVNQRVTIVDSKFRDINFSNPGGGDEPMLGVPIAIWATLISAGGAIGAAIIGLRKKP